MKTIEFKSLARFSQDKMQKTGVLETSRVTTDLYCFEPGQAQRSHKHDDADKIYFVLEGSGTFRIGDAERELGKHEFAIAQSGVSHGVENRSAARLAVLVFMAPRPVH